MLEQELKNIWKGSNEVELVKFDKSRILLKMDSKVKSLERSIWWRDWREFAAAGIMIPVSVVMAFLITPILSKIASIGLLFYMIYVIYKLRAVKKYKPKDISISLLSYLKKKKIYITKEMKLIDNVFYWYLLPPAIGLAVIFYGYNVGLLIFAIRMTVMIVLYYIIYKMNKKAVKEQYEPVVEQLRKTIEQLDS